MSAEVRIERFTADGGRRPSILPLGAVVHREELSGADTLEFSCASAPTKYDRLLWRDPEDGRWREHVVARTEERAGGCARVVAESSICDLRASFIDEIRFVQDTAGEALTRVLEDTGWDGTALGIETLGSCLIYHASVRDALSRVIEVWGAEAEPEIAVGPHGVTRRREILRARVGAWRGARLTYGRSMAGCVRTVASDEVYTALYGFGAGLPVLDDEGWTGGYHRKLNFGDVNGGVKWTGNDRARETWGILGEDGTRRHRFGQVTFPGEDDPLRLLARTKAALAEISSPRITYEVDAQVFAGRVPVGLGDDVLVTDTEPPAPRRALVRCVARVREVSPDGAIRSRYTLGRPDTAVRRAVLG